MTKKEKLFLELESLELDKVFLIQSLFHYFSADEIKEFIEFLNNEIES